MNANFANRMFTFTGICLLGLFGVSLSLDAGEIYTDTKKLPRARGFKYIQLKEAEGSPKLVEFTASLVEIEHSRKRGEFVTGIRTEQTNQLLIRKSMRLGLQSIDKSHLPVRVRSEIVLKEDGIEIERSDEVLIEETAPRWAIDFTGFIDVTGTFEDIQRSGRETISEKKKHAVAEIVGAMVEIEGKGGNILYRGAWPEAPEAVPQDATRELKRTITSSDGRKIDAFIKAINKESITIVTEGETFTLPFNQLSEDDWDYFQRRWQELESDSN